MLDQPVEGPPVGVAGEVLRAVNEVEQRQRADRSMQHRSALRLDGLAPQGMDDMVIIDDVAVLARDGGTSARQGHERGAANEQTEAVVIR